MNTRSVLFILSMAVIFNVKGQYRNNAISLNAEAVVPAYQNYQGIGFFIKGMYGICTSAQLTVSVGVSVFNLRNKVEQGQVNTRLIPVLLGYRQNIHRFFVEPQVGIGELGGKIKTEGDYARPSVAAVFGGIGAGYIFRRLNAGIRFQTARGIEDSSAGTWYNRSFHYTSIFIGYNIFSKRRG